MRPTCLLILAFALARPAAAAEEAVPQDPALSAKRSKEWLEWNRRTLAGAYDRVGKKDPRWDAKAREAMEIAAKAFSLQVDPVVPPSEIQAPAKAAVDAGCDDPMILYLQHRSEIAQASVKPEERARRSKELAAALGASEYPAFRRAFFYQMVGKELAYREGADPASLEAARGYFDSTLALLPGTDAGDVRGPFWEDRWYDALAELTAGYRKTGLDPLAAHERVDAALAKTPELEALRLKVRGRFWHDYGWEARTKAFAPAVPRGGFASLGERLAKAREALEASYAIRPDSAAAVMLMDIDKTIGGDREVMEKWFERAMKLNPDNRAACLTKLDWLDPKWHGSWEEMIAFGRACKATGNWRTGIVLLGADAHFRVASLMKPAEMTRYLSPPEVWDDIGPAYDEFLKHYPENDVARSKYAMLCYRAGRYGQAHGLFKSLGDRLTSWSEFPYTPLKELQGMRDQLAAQAK